MPSGAEVVVGGLEQAGVEIAFGVPGVHNLALWHALARSRIRLVTVRHEQTAAYAADGFARASGRLGVALTTTGPGAANTLAAVGEAWASGSPVVVIATDIATSLRRPGVYRGALHETTDQAAMFAPVTKATVRVSSGQDIAAVLEAALQAARQPPAGPVYVEIPTDLLPGPAAPPAPLRAEPVLAVPDVTQAATLLGAAQRPLLWAGGGAQDAGRAVAALAERLAAPLLATFAARGIVPADHPCLVGLPPHVPEAGQLWDEADLVVVVGSDLDAMDTQNWAMPQPPRLVALNVDARDAVKNYAADVVVVGDAAVTAAALAEAVTPRTGLQELARRLRALRARARERLESEQPEAVAFLDAVAGAVPSETVLVLDMCIPGYWLAGFHAVPAPRKLAYPVGWGTLGFAFPAAIGAALAGAGPVVSVSGDGGFLYAPGELATVAQERVPLTAVIVDDGGYGMLRYDQRRAGTPPFGVDLHTPDFVALARSFGVGAEQVDGLGEAFGAALARCVRTEEPTVLVARAALDPPPTTSPRWYRSRP